MKISLDRFTLVGATAAGDNEGVGPGLDRERQHRCDHKQNRGLDGDEDFHRAAEMNFFRIHRRLMLYSLCALLFAALLVAVFVTSKRIADERARGQVLALSLIDQNGAPWHFGQLGEAIALVYFGYASCPDVCPTALADLSRIVEDWPAGGATLVAVFVSVDPARDTGPVLKRYLAHFGPDLVALSGSEKEIKRAMRAFGIFANRVKGKADGGYLINHSSKIFAVNAAGDAMLLLAEPALDKLPAILAKSALPALVKPGS